MVFWNLLLLFAFAYIAQVFLVMIQIKDFNLNYKDLRKIGMVAIGKKKGGFFAGAIVMFAIDKKGNIIKGKYMTGVTVFCRFKNLNDFNGINISNINEEQVKKYSKQVRQAILDSSSNYTILINGGTIEEPKSPFQKLVHVLKK